MSRMSFPILELTADAVQTYLIIYAVDSAELTEDLVRSIAAELQGSRTLKHAFRNELARAMYDRYADARPNGQRR